MKTFKIALFIVLSASLYAQPVEFAFFSTSENLRCEVTVNGFPLIELPDNPVTQTRTSVLSAFVQNGVNEVEVTFHDAHSLDTDGSTYLVDPNFSRIRIETYDGSERELIFQLDRTVHRFDEPVGYQRIQYIFTEEQGLEFDTRKDKGEPFALDLTVDPVLGSFRYDEVPGTGPSTFRIDLNLNSPVTSLPWNLPEVPFDQDARDEIFLILEQIIEGFTTEDAEKIADCFDYKFARLAEASGRTVASLRNEVLAFYTNRIFPEPGITFAPVTTDGIVYEQFPGANLIRVKRSDGDDAIRASSADLEFGIPLYFSFVDGAWVIVE